MSPIWIACDGGLPERQWRDIRGIVRVQGDALNREYLRANAPVLDVAELLERVLSE